MSALPLEGGHTAASSVTPELAPLREMSRSAPGMMRQRFEVSRRFDAKQRGVGAERPTGDRAECRFAEDGQHFAKLRRATLELGDGLVGWDRARTGHGVVSPPSRHDLR